MGEVRAVKRLIKGQKDTDIISLATGMGKICGEKTIWPIGRPMEFREIVRQRAETAWEVRKRKGEKGCEIVANALNLIGRME